MIEDLLTRSAVRELVDRYAVEVDRHDGDAVAALFVPDGRLELHRDGIGRPVTSVVAGGDAIAAAIDGLARYRVTTHLVGQHLVDLVDGDVATGVAYCLAHHVGAEGDPSANRVDSIRYLDDYVRTDDGWRFVRRRLSFDWSEVRTVLV